MENNLDFNILRTFLDQLYDILPKILWTVFFIFLGWVIYKLIILLIRSVLKLSKIDRLSAKINEADFLEKSSFKIDVSRIILFFAKCFIILVLFIMGADMLGLTAVSDVASQIITYLPRFLSGVAILAIGIVIATFIKKTIQGMLLSFDMSGSKFISGLAFYIILIIATITALNQIGINTDIITNNILILLGAFLAAFTIALGLGSKDIVYRLILGFYTRKNLEAGMRIRVNGVEGVIVLIDNISLIIALEDRKVVFPIKNITNRNIEILHETP
ncbi:mechanosensitive ion channel family protein [Sinomicrobium oceani]|uniref:mechanosensitive ion channel family protein n=1 Tax=Sinomicrobium oceani TaxID=1150368 RepID=UPI00227CBF90|nr:small-conductance mechanosensitive channel [Sinomicrobium oceani]